MHVKWDFNIGKWIGNREHNMLLLILEHKSRLGAGAKPPFRILILIGRRIDCITKDGSFDTTCAKEKRGYRPYRTEFMAQ